MDSTQGMAHRYRWVIMGVLWATYIVVFMHRLSVGPLAPVLKEDLNLTSTQVGSLMSAAAFGYMLSILPGGWATDRLGVRRLLAIGALAGGVFMLGMFFVQSYYAALIIMAVSGFGTGCLLPSTTKGVVEWFPVNERATVMGLKQTSVNIAGIATSVMLPAVALAVGWRFGFIFLGALAICIGIFSLILYKEPPATAKSSAVEGVSVVNVFPSDKGQSMRDLLRSKDIWLISFAGLALAAVEFGLIAHLVLYLTEALCVPVVTAGIILAVTQAGGIFGKPGAGFISDKLFGGRRRSVLSLWGGIAGIICILIAFWGEVLSWALYPLLFILGATAIGWGGVYLTLVAELAGVHLTGRATAITGFAVVIGVMIGPMLFGYFVDKFHSYQLAWLSLGIWAAVFVAILFFVREGKK